jgi:hypothetical protein
MKLLCTQNILTWLTVSAPQSATAAGGKPLALTLKDRHNRQQTNRKMPTLRKIKRAVFPYTSRPKTAHLILPDTPKPTHHPNIVENFFGLFLSINFLSLFLDII